MKPPALISALRERFGLFFNVTVEDARSPDPPPELDEEYAREDIIGFVHRLLMEALDAGATAMRLEPRPECLVVSLLADGVWREDCAILRIVADRVVRRLRVMADMNPWPSSTGAVEEGLMTHVRYRRAGEVLSREYSLAISFTPTKYGESVTLQVFTPDEVDD